MPDPARHVASITGLRAIAVLAVILFHLDPAWMPGGFVGVDCFFVISGFVVAHSVMGAHSAIDGPANGGLAFVAEFYRRRFLRLYPALLVYIAIATTASLLFIPFVEMTSRYEEYGAAAALGLSPFLLMQMDSGYFSLGTEFNLFAHTWSLGVEEQYYVLFSLFAFPLLVRGSPRLRKWLIALLAVATVASIAFSAVTTVSDPSYAFYMLPTRFWELAIGLLLRIALDLPSITRWAATARRPGEAIAAGALALLVFSCWTTSRDGFPFPGALLPCLATAALIAALWLWRDCRVAHLLQTPLPQWIGKTSYSLYLWHWGVIVAMRWTVGVDSPALKLLALTATFATGAASYYGIERAFRRPSAPPLSSPRFFLRFAGTVGLVAALCLGSIAIKPDVSLAAASRLAIWNPYSAPPEPRPCVATLTERAAAGLTFLSFTAPCRKPTARKLFVLGDSHAAAYSRMLWRTAETGDWDVYLYSLPACGLINFRVLQRYPACEALTAGATHEIARMKGPGDVIFLPSLQTERFRTAWGVYEKPIYSETRIDPAIFVANRARLKQLSGLGLPMIVEGAKPLMLAALFRCADWFNRDQTYCREGGSIDKRVMELRMHVPETGLRSIVAGVPLATLWDVTDMLCPGTRCNGYDHGLPLFVDVDHLSAHGNDFLFPAFLKTLDSVKP